MLNMPRQKVDSHAQAYAGCKFRVAQVQKPNAQLEQRVMQRTAALQQANREFDAFSYSAAHDLGAPPLCGIDGLSQMLVVKRVPISDLQIRKGSTNFPVRARR